MNTPTGGVGPKNGGGARVLPPPGRTESAGGPDRRFTGSPSGPIGSIRFSGTRALAGWAGASRGPPAPPRENEVEAVFQPAPSPGAGQQPDAAAQTEHGHGQRPLQRAATQGRHQQ